MLSGHKRVLKCGLMTSRHMGKKFTVVETSSFSRSCSSKRTFVLITRARTRLKVFVIVFSGSVGVLPFPVSKLGVLGFCTLWLQQKLSIGTELSFAAWRWRGSCCEAERGLAWSPARRRPSPAAPRPTAGAEHTLAVCGLTRSGGSPAQAAGAPGRRASLISNNTPAACSHTWPVPNRSNLNRNFYF